MLQEMLVRNCNCLCKTDMEWEGDGWEGVYTGEVLWRVYIGGVLWSVYAGKVLVEGKEMVGKMWENGKVMQQTVVSHWNNNTFSYFICYV